MSADPYPARTPCLFEDCHASAEEHHRVNVGLLNENIALKRKVAELSGQIKAAEVVQS